MGFDFGFVRIGVAVGSLDSGHAEPLTTLSARNGQPDWDKVVELTTAWQPTTFVIGKPSSTNSPPGPALTCLLRKLMEFRDALQARFAIPIEFSDERCTSTEARYLLREQRRAGRPGKIRKGEIDMTAAAVILQSWLSQNRKN